MEKEADVATSTSALLDKKKENDENYDSDKKKEIVCLTPLTKFLMIDQNASMN